MAYPNIATKEDLAKELRDHAKAAERLEQLIHHVEAVLLAVNGTDLLDRIPGDELAIEKHDAACALLSELQRKLRAHEARPGTDLSISLDVLALDISSGVRFNSTCVPGEHVPTLSSAN